MAKERGKKDSVKVTRVLSNDFLIDLREGVLLSLLEQIQGDDTLLLSIRSGFINVYYRGGSLLRIEQRKSGGYIATFDTNYNKTMAKLPKFPFSISSSSGARKLVGHIPILKHVMDCYLSIYPKPEREFQQLVARENNRSAISNGTEYFIVDIEVADSSLQARYDMLAVRWLRKDRTKQNSLVPVLIEMKYGVNALNGKAGLAEHCKDMESLRLDEEKWGALIATIEGQLKQLVQLGLMKFTGSKQKTSLCIDTTAKPEVIFLLANMNPESTKLKDALKRLEVDPKMFDVSFFSSSFAGYGMYKANMLDIRQIREAADNLFARATKGA